MPTLTPHELSQGYQKCSVCKNVCLSDICSSCKEEARQKKEIKENGGNIPYGFKQWFPVERGVDITPERMSELVSSTPRERE